MSINELFGNENKEVSTNTRMLSGTAELTRVAGNIATEIIRSMEDQIDDYRDRIAKSATDTKEMDALLDEFRPWTDIEEDDLLRNLDDDTVEGMLKSQQSKRSRLKGKQMTLDNYRSLMTATIAESLLRELYDKPKQATTGYHRSGSLDYTPAQLESLAADQEALRREIRNVQSKKSIMKSKADFDEASERWMQLLKAEQMLKDLRVDIRGTSTIEVDHTKNKLQEMLGDVDVEHLKASDSKELLAKIMGMLSDESAESSEDRVDG